LLGTGKLRVRFQNDGPFVRVATEMAIQLASCAERFSRTGAFHP
jgi:hypothetical protein